MSATRGRLAPSPTGGLHVGNVRTFMLAWLSARAAGGAVVLRIEDLDRARCKPGYTAQLIDDLRWLGFDWDEGPNSGGPVAPYLQSERGGHYRAALARLVTEGYAYPCVCSRAELAGIAGAPHGSHGPMYPGTCRDRFRDAADARACSGREPSWRFDSRRLPEQPWADSFAGGVMPATVDDFVLFRADGVPSYQLAVVADDLAMGITEVVRGDDLISSTPRQLALFEVFGVGERPRYFHVPLVLDSDGRRLAKRSGATQVAELRRLGIHPEAVIGRLACGLDLTESSGPCPLPELIPAFDWRRVPHEPSVVLDSDLVALAG